MAAGWFEKQRSSARLMKWIEQLEQWIEQSGYPLTVYKVTLKWTGPVNILTKGQLESNLMNPFLGCFCF